ncbi:hypothetical protein SAMN02745152_02167 [Treponema berlinense]|uniref:DUF7424 domain-containing protein n=1 Tax=Treponema berlinense TaxID=225004 RepID=A0A1T4QYF2_9SPIR|nr:hypothetical protein [Treponema berlinense]SKA08760.1 hypothetical protein SAMN02745152_02167 [Treponema berlinense]
MKKRIYGITLLFLLCFLFLGCGGEIKISIFTRDLQDVLASRNEVIYTNVNIIVESLQDENDISFLRNCLNGFSNEHIIEYNYSTSLSFDIKVPIIRDGTNLDFSKDLLIIEGKNNNDNLDFYVKYNRDLLSRIDRYFYNTHYQNIELSKFKIRMEINNDERKSLNLITYSAYVNGKAYPFEHNEELKERDRITVEISEIFGKYISNMNEYEKKYPIFSIK